MTVHFLSPIEALDMPTAEHVAVAIVEAARATGEKCPLKVLTDMKNSRARAYAFYALRKGFPDLEVKRVGWMVGSKPTEAGTSWLRAAHKQAWWNDAVARRVAAAVRRVRVPEQFMEAAE